MRSTAYCCGATSWCPTGTAAPPTSPTGTASAGRPRAPAMHRSPSIPGGSTRRRTRRCSAGRRNDGWARATPVARLWLHHGKIAPLEWRAPSKDERFIDVRLHPAPADAGGADPDRHHGGQLLHHPGGARGAGRADAGADPGHLGRRDRALLGQHERRRDRAQIHDRHLGQRRRRLSRRARPAQGADPAHREDVRLRQADLRAFLPDDEELPRLRLRRELLPQQERGRPGAREDAGVDLARPVDHADHLFHLHPPRHRQGGARRLALRRLDLDDPDRAERHPGLPVRPAAGRAVRRRRLFQMVPAARPGLGRLELARPDRQGARLPVAHGAADRRHGDRRVRHAHLPHQELVPRGDQQAVRADRPRQGPGRTARALRPRLPQCHADRDRGLSRRLHRRAVHRLAPDRGDLLARRHRPPGLRGGAQPRLSDHVRYALFLRPDRPGDGNHRRPHLYLRRSAHRLRGARLMTPLNRRRFAAFRASKRGMVSLVVFGVLFFVSLFAEFLANDRPLLIYYDGSFYSPMFRDYPETTFGGDFPTNAVYTDAELQKSIHAKGWLLWPPIPYSYNTVLKGEGRQALLPPSWAHPLGTDDQARDVLARLIYGFRISVLFGLVLTILSTIIGIAAGAIQGYFGGLVDLSMQRFLEIWSSMPTLYLLIILASFIQPGFWVLLGIMLLFSWMALVGLVRAEFLRGRNFDYVRAARALGMLDARIMFRHILPNAMTASLTFLPFIVAGSVTTLTSLDFLGFGLPPGSPSLGELLLQGKNNLNAPWLAFTGFAILALMMSLLVFIGEAVRDAFNPRKVPV